MHLNGLPLTTKAHIRAGISGARIPLPKICRLQCSWRTVIAGPRANYSEFTQYRCVHIKQSDFRRVLQQKQNKKFHHSLSPFGATDHDTHVRRKNGANGLMTGETAALVALQTPW